MCYLVARNPKQCGAGCYAWETQHGPELVALKRYLRDKSPLERLELVTISRPVAYGEYAPYHIAKSRDELINLVLSMKEAP